MRQQSTAWFRAPYKAATVQGLGRTYVDISHFRAPFKAGMMSQSPYEGFGVYERSGLGLTVAAAQVAPTPAVPEDALVTLAKGWYKGTVDSWFSLTSQLGKAIVDTPTSTPSALSKDLLARYVAFNLYKAFASGAPLSHGKLMVLRLLAWCQATAAAVPGADSDMIPWAPSAIAVALQMTLKAAWEKVHPPVNVGLMAKAPVFDLQPANAVTHPGDGIAIYGTPPTRKAPPEPDARFCAPGDSRPECRPKDPTCPDGHHVEYVGPERIPTCVPDPVPEAQPPQDEGSTLPTWALPAAAAAGLLLIVGAVVLTRKPAASGT